MILMSYMPIENHQPNPTHHFIEWKWTTEMQVQSSFQCALIGFAQVEIHVLPLSYVIAIFPLSETVALDQRLKVELWLALLGHFSFLKTDHLVLFLEYCVLVK